MKPTPFHYPLGKTIGFLHRAPFTGKPMKGYVFVDPPGFESDADLARWVKLCRRFVDALPAKK